MTDPLFARFGREFPAGVVLFREGETGEDMYVIQSGLVAITKRTGDVERPLASLGRGEFLGEMAILNGKPRTATATVVEDAKCLVIDARTLELMISKNPEIALRLVKKLASRLDAADALVQILLNPDPQARVLLALQRHADNFGEATPEGIRVNVSPEEIALQVGVPTAQVHDVLTRLRRLRIAQEQGTGALVIADVGRLHEFLELVEMPRKFEAN
jgi:CRP-like cAMP-binding protein